MNIRIPYEKLSIKSCKFVSLILDKNKQSVYRLDMFPHTHPDIYNRAQLCINIPDNLYDQCDSVIFFPFYHTTNNWGTKTVMWKNEDFVLMNGGFEHVRNADVAPNTKKVEEWINKGVFIRDQVVSSSIIGSKNLIYFTLFGNNEYLKLLTLLLTTLKLRSLKDFDLLFITDDDTKIQIQKIKEVENFSVDFHIVKNVNDAVSASMQKLKIFDYPNINSYKNILFLDVDIIVVGDAGRIFSSNASADIFYSATHNHHQSMHSTVYHSLIDYTPAQLVRFAEKNIGSINAGQFFFRNSEKMRLHFQHINTFISSWNGRYFFEQSFLNHYFNLLEISDVTKFKDEFQFVSINENQKTNSFGPNSVFVHFMGNAGNGSGKLEFMKKHYSTYVLT